jgi:hypothetical protein
MPRQSHVNPLRETRVSIQRDDLHHTAIRPAKVVRAVAPSGTCKIVVVDEENAECGLYRVAPSTGRSITLLLKT